jgi:hypothetical protein
MSVGVEKSMTTCVPRLLKRAVRIVGGGMPLASAAAITVTFA